MDAAENIFRRFLDLFGNDFHLEVARHSIEEEEKVTRALEALALKYGTTPVLTNDVHYLDAADWRAHEVIIRTRYDRPNDFTTNSREFWLKSDEEMAALGFPNAYSEQAAAIADACEDISFDSASASPLPPTMDDPERLIASGQAAYLGRINYIDEETARRHVREVYKDRAEDVVPLARVLTGIPRFSEPDAEQVVCTPGRSLREIVPLKRSMGKIITQWDEGACKRAGARVLSIRPSLLSEKLSRFLR
jgi:DNA polymerase III alpha subunit